MTRMRVFWSVYCILVGVALLVKILFRLDFSGWTVAFAILLLESGVFLVTGGFGLRRGRSAQGSGDYFFYSARSSCPPRKTRRRSPPPFPTPRSGSPAGCLPSRA